MTNINDSNGDRKGRLHGFSEALVMVSDLPTAVEQWQGLAGWELAAKEGVDPAWLQLWGLEATAGGHEALLQAPGAQSGGIRFVQLTGVDTEDIRPNPQTWDSGGLLDLNVRVADMDACQHTFREAGWRGYSDPVRWRFGAVTVSEWLAMGPDGLALALIQRLDPPLPAAQLPQGIGPVFNSSQVVSDMPRSLAFYVDGLGMQPVLQVRQPLLPEAGENPLGIPHNLVAELEVEIVVLSPSGQLQGSVELICMHGLEGRDFRERSRPPNRGMLGLRFPVEDLAAFTARVRAAGYALEGDALEVRLPPQGRVRVAALRAPEGAWLEFYELV